MNNLFKVHNTEEAVKTYKLISNIILVLAGVCLLLSAGTFVCYQLSGTAPVINTDRKGQLENALMKQPVMGMIFFLLILFGLVLAIFAGYRALQYSRSKDKIPPNKLLPWLMAASGVLNLGTLPFFFMIIAENGRTQIGIIICMVFTILYAVASLLLIPVGIKQTTMFKRFRY